MKLLSFFILLFSLSLSAQAIINIENARLNSHEPGRHGHLSFSLSGSDGSSDKIKLGLGGKLVSTFTQEQWISIFSREFEQANGNKSADKTFLHQRYLRFSSPQWGHEYFVQYEDDEFQALSSRYLLGAGARFSPVQTNDIHHNAFGFGAFYELEEVHPASADKYRDETLRANLYWSYKRPINDHARLLSTLYFQPALDDSKDQKGLWQFSASFDISNKLVLLLRLEVKHDTQAPEAIVATDSSYKTILKYSF